ncbi:phosphoribosylglycinamide synthetase C domain-containing protein [Nitrososphaera sp.]|uniref:phosphoribosylglycinamide synthetase C domain-containing protein n=1 Tax=Nitrososphaera sp. TaxID=1971748 RepID=UPI002EDB9A3F
MKFLFVSPEALSLDLAYTILQEGNEVKFCVQSATEKDVGDGFVDKIDEWEPHVDSADVIVFDDIGFGKTADRLRSEGKKVVGGSSYTDRLENEREFGQQELEKAGVSVLPSWNFSDFEEAIKFVQDNPSRYVIKPSGKAQNEKELLFVGQEADGNDVINVLARYKKRWSNKIRIFQLQKFSSGVEVAVGAFFNGKEFAHPININFEHKRLFPDNIGPSTGEMGTLAWWSARNKIFEYTLEKIKPKLAESRYVGYIDINCIANGTGIYPLEFTSRFGYPTISIHMEGVTSKWGQFLYSLASGENAELQTKRGFQIAVVIAVPPFPFNDEKTFRKFSEEAIILFNKPDLTGVHLGEVKREGNDWHIAGRSGYSLVVTGSGDTTEEARAVAYKRVANIMIPNMFYRTDIGSRWVRDSDLLLSFGYMN